MSVQTGSGESYFNAFAVHLKATNGQIALLASLPPLVGSVAQLLSAWLGRRLGSRRTLILLGVRLQAAMWLPIILLPPLLPEHAMTLFLICAVFYYAAGNLIAPQWSSLMGDLVSPRKRGRYFAFRNRLATFTSLLSLVCAGLVLHLFDGAGLAYVGFAVIFLLATSGRMVSAWHLAQMHDPPGKVAVLETRPQADLWQRVRHSAFARFTVFYAAMHGAVAVASPFFTVYMLRDLHYSYLQLMVGLAASLLAQVLMLNTWGCLCDRYGHRTVLAITGLLTPLLPALWMLSTDYFYLLAVQAYGGAVWSGFVLSAGNHVYDLVPPHKRVTYLAYHAVLSNTATFVGALLGGWIALTLPAVFVIGGLRFDLPSTLPWVFFFSFVLRLAVALALFPHVQGVVAAVKQRRRPCFAVRFQRFNALTRVLETGMRQLRGFARANMVLLR
ncbi:MAG: MFS transporter [Gammaproteobacteria bacterium]|nr:MFS transporter [Gammaproteobacteria bacterium]